MNIKLKLKLQHYGFTEIKPNVMEFTHQKLRIVVDDTGYTYINASNEEHAKIIEDMMTKLGVNKNNKTIKESKIDLGKILEKQDFEYDEENGWCKVFKDHDVCIDKNQVVSFFALDIPKFLKGHDERKTRWIERFRRMGIEVKGFKEPEEFDD
jgi:hypothetical protein